MVQTDLGGGVPNCFWYRGYKNADFSCLFFPIKSYQVKFKLLYLHIAERMHRPSFIFKEMIFFLHFLVSAVPKK